MRKVTLKNKPVILENKDFQTILIQVMFPFKKNSEDLAHLVLLPSLLNFMNNKYKNESDFVLARKKLLILATGVSKSTFGRDGYFTFDMIVPDTYALGKDILNEQFEFFKEIIYNPRIENDGFLKFELDREINNVKRNIDNTLKNMMPYHAYKVKKLIDDEGILSESLIDNVDLLDKVTPQSLYQYYLKTIKENNPIIYVFGNVDKKQITNLCMKHLYLNKFDMMFCNYVLSESNVCP